MTPFPVYILMLIAFNALAVIYLGYVTLEILNSGKYLTISQKIMWRMRIGLWVPGGIILAIVLFLFFTQWLPALQFALQTAI